MGKLLGALLLLLGLALPAQAATCQCRIASPSVLSDWLYLVGYNGNKVEWGATALTLPSGWSVKVQNTGLAGSTLYYVYAFDNAGAVALELSPTGHVVDANGDQTMVGDPSRLLVGMVYTDPAGQFWRDAQHAFILNWFNRLPIFAAPPAAGISTSTHYPHWEELGSLSANQVEILTWGYQLGIAENVVIGVSGAATASLDGARLDLVFGDLAIGAPGATSSWIIVTASKAGQWQNVSGASTMAFPEGHHVITFWARTHGTAAAVIYLNTFASTNG